MPLSSALPACHARLPRAFPWPYQPGQRTLDALFSLWRGQRRRRRVSVSNSAYIHKSFLRLEYFPMARIKLAYIGGGSTRAAGTMASFIWQGMQFNGSEVVLIDLDADRLNVVATIAR